MTAHYRINGSSIIRIERCDKHQRNCKCDQPLTAIASDLTLANIAELITSAGQALSLDHALVAEDQRRRLEDEAEAARWEAEMDS